MTITQVLLNALNALLLVLVPAIGAVLVAYINSLRVKTQNEAANTLYNKYLYIVQNAVSQAVDATSKTFVDVLKSDGAFTKEKWSEAMALTIASAKQLMGDAGIEFIETLTVDVDGYITTLAESILKQLEQ